MQDTGKRVDAKATRAYLSAGNASGGVAAIS